MRDPLEFAAFHFRRSFAFYAFASVSSRAAPDTSSLKQLFRADVRAAAARKLFRHRDNREISIYGYGVRTGRCTRLRRGKEKESSTRRRLRLSQRCSRKHLISKACPPVADQYSTTPTFRDPPLQPAPPPLPPHYPLVGSFMLPAAPTSATLGIVMTLARLPCSSFLCVSYVYFFSLPVFSLILRQESTIATVGVWNESFASRDARNDVI